MDWTHLLAFNLALLAAMAAPGPALLFALRQSVSGGFRTGVSTGLGLALIAALWTAAALLGLEAVFALFPTLFVTLKLVGAGYLIYVAYGLWRDARQPVADNAAPGARAFLGGVLVNLANPKSILFAASVLVVIFPADLTLSDKALITFNHFVVEAVVYALFAAALSSGPARAGYLRMKPVIDRVSGALLGLLGARLLLDR